MLDLLSLGTSQYLVLFLTTKILLMTSFLTFYFSSLFLTGSEPALFGTRKWKMLVAFKCLLEIQSRAAKIDAIGMFFYTEGKICQFWLISTYEKCMFFKVMAYNIIC